MANLTNILIVLSEAAIALISITTAIYAIGLPFLKRRMREALSKSKTKRQELKDDLERSLYDEDFVKNMKSRIEAHEQEEKRMFDQMGFLSMKRAIVYPCTLFSLSLFLSCLFIYLITESVQSINLFSLSIPVDPICLLIPTILLLSGVYFLVRIFSAVETVALMPEAMPRIAIADFPKDIHAGEEREIIVQLRNVGGDIARNIKAFVYLPAGFEILKSSGRSYVSTTTRPGLHVAAFDLNRLDVRVTVYLGRVTVRAPSKLGIYKIFVTFREERVKYEEQTLKIEVKA